MSRIASILLTPDASYRSVSQSIDPGRSQGLDTQPNNSTTAMKMRLCSRRFVVVLCTFVSAFLLVVFLSDFARDVNKHEERLACTPQEPVSCGQAATDLSNGVNPSQQNQKEAKTNVNIDSQPYRVPLTRDILRQEDWPERQPGDHSPGLIPPVVHYLWCGNRKFRFQDYLSVLSAVKFLQPVKFIFHYTHMPQTDSYNSWFQELTASLAGLELQELSPKSPCGSMELLKTGLGFLSGDGGVLIGGGVILTRFPKQFTRQTASFIAFASSPADKTQGVVFAKSGWNEQARAAFAQLIDKITSGERAVKDNCSSIEAYNADHGDAVCVTARADVMNPRDITEAQTPFAELARWLFYGSRGLALPRQDYSNLIPRISHFVRLKGGTKPEDKPMYNREEFSFNHMLNILSALYVAGFEQVFVHLEGNEPTGRWWEEVKKEKNVTVVKAVRPSSVYQKKVGVVQHVSDILRYLILYKYGGAYQDFDVTWTSRVPDSLLAYPAVAGIEWEKKEQDWVDSFNLGVILARPGSQWFRLYIDTHKDFRDSDWGFNSLRMSYKTWELYPHALMLDRHLQVICCFGTCHPPWLKGYAGTFTPQEVRAVHVTCPKPHPGLASPESISRGKDVFANIGRQVLEKSGRQHLIS